MKSSICFHYFYRAVQQNYFVASFFIQRRILVPRDMLKGDLEYFSNLCRVIRIEIPLKRALREVFRYE
jgi:hypothetical protein